MDSLLVFPGEVHSDTAAGEQERPAGFCWLGSSCGAHCWGRGRSRVSAGAACWEWKGEQAPLELQKGSRLKLLGSEAGDFLKKLGGSLASLPGYCLKAENLPGSRQSAGERRGKYRERLLPQSGLCVIEPGLSLMKDVLFL